MIWHYAVNIVNVNCVVGAQTIGLIQIAIVSYFDMGFVCFQANLLETSDPKICKRFEKPLQNACPLCSSLLPPVP